ncbi:MULTISPECIES: hypothetical protein [Ramlibacter]|uniref:Uncharacterized protein n=1 Tax=Ramlibacter pinisoli TaxID=2682844 RepID=A0A6N8IQI8_9BURK|nr:MULTISPECIES: hypothetical protein [Ramlibacter]MBA2964108.1 hypothetical protein [Ramlibacter sp. CGMCC 1.13660]MVQ29074.1 hypothetical protein [Ramlibacter pinisoli]
MKLAKTDLGQRVLKDRSVPLTPRQRAAFILCDGRNTVDQVLAATASVGVTREDIDHLLQENLLEPAGPAPAAATPAAAAPVSDRTAQQRYQEAYPVATRLTAGLGLRGFRLNLAVEGATNFEQLRELAPRIREAVGDKAYADLDRALNA